VRLHVLGMGALTVSQDGYLPPSEQSNEPCPDVGVTHDGVGSDWTQADEVVDHSHPAGHAPESGTGIAMHP
jgi:hypothetical protein